jgi:hypothetical protein
MKMVAANVSGWNGTLVRDTSLCLPALLAVSYENVGNVVGISSKKPTQLIMSNDLDNDDTPVNGILLEDDVLSSLELDDSFNETTVSDVRILNVGGPARDVASLLGLELQDTLPLPGDKPVVVVVSEPAEVDTLLEVENRSWIGCIIAWQLPEASIERLFQLGVTVFVGLPQVQQVMTAIEYLPDESALGEARSFAARLATIEALLTDI